MSPVCGLHFDPLTLSCFYPCARDLAAWKNQCVYAVATNNRHNQTGRLKLAANPCFCSLERHSAPPLAKLTQGCNVMGER
jgi:hypothetical protein